MKKFLWLAFAIMLLMPLAARGAETDALGLYDIETEADGYGLDTLDGFIGDAEGYFTEGESFSDMVIGLASGGRVIDAQSVFKLIGKGLLGECFDCASLLLSVLAVSLLFSLLNNMKSSFGSGVSETAFFVCYLILSGIVFKAFIGAASLAADTVRSAAAFLSALIPVLMAMLAAGGRVVSAATISPVITVASQLAVVAAQRLLLPLLYSSAALYTVSEINESVSVARFADFLKKTVKWSLCLMLTVFVGILGIQSFCSTPVDTAAAKTAKYVIGTAVPVVGSILSDTVETVVGCSMILKNAAGAAGMIAVMAIACAPVLRILAVCAVFHISAALIEPVADKRITNAVSNIASVTSLIAAIVITAALLFIVCIGSAVAVGSAA